jgi:hypothetical protein
MRRAPGQGTIVMGTTRGRRPLVFRPEPIELETRTLLSMIHWTGADAASDTKWSDGANWAEGAAPGIGDTAVFDANNPTGTPDVSTVDKLYPIVALKVEGTWTGTIEVDSPLTLTGGFALGAGTIDLHSTMIVTGTSSWTGGAIGGGGTLTNEGTIDIATPSSSVTLESAVTLDNVGTIAKSGGGIIFLESSAVIDNKAGGVFELDDDSSIFGSFIDLSHGTIKNAGTFSKAMGSSMSSVTGPFENNGGIIDVKSGTLKLAGGGASTGGEFDAAAGATLDLVGGSSPTFTGGYHGSGTGTVTWTGHPLTVGAAGASFDFTPGLLVWTSPITGGLFTNTGSITAAGGLLDTGSTLENDGTVDVTATVNLDGTAVVKNESEGIINLKGDVGFTAFTGSTDSIDNIGTLQKTSGTGVSTISPPVNNEDNGLIDGKIIVMTGTLVLGGGGSSTGGTFAVAGAAMLDLTGSSIATYTGEYTGSGAGVVGWSGILNVGAAGATFDFPMGLLDWTELLEGAGGLINTGWITVDTAKGSPTLLAGSSLVNPGTIDEVGGGSFTLPSGTTLDNTGTVEGSGTIIANVTNEGTVAPGGPGTAGLLTIMGGFSQSAAGTLAIKLGGTGTGMSDQLAVTGAATLGGTLAVTRLGGFTPAHDDTFRVMTFGSSTGGFSTRTGLDLGSGRRLLPILDASGLTLQEEAATPPVLATIGDQTVAAGSTVHVTAMATDALTGVVLTYSLDPGAPAGSIIDPATGVFTWTAPASAISALVTVRVTDNGSPALVATATFGITVTAPSTTAGGSSLSSSSSGAGGSGSSAGGAGAPSSSGAGGSTSAPHPDPLPSGAAAGTASGTTSAAGTTTSGTSGSLPSGPAGGSHHATHHGRKVPHGPVHHHRRHHHRHR